MAGFWAESDDALAHDGDYTYYDTIVAMPDMATSGMVEEHDVELVNAVFANKPLWVIARLEVDDATKYLLPDPLTL